MHVKLCIKHSQLYSLAEVGNEKKSALFYLYFKNWICDPTALIQNYPIKNLDAWLKKYFSAPLQRTWWLKDAEDGTAMQEWNFRLYFCTDFLRKVTCVSTLDKLAYYTSTITVSVKSILLLLSYPRWRGRWWWSMTPKLEVRFQKIPEIDFTNW